MKREKGESDYTDKEKDMDDQFFLFGQLSFPLQYRSLQFQVYQITFLLGILYQARIT